MDLAAFQQAVEDLYNGTSSPPPATSPKAAPGKNVWIIPLTLQSSSNVATAAGAADAAKALGWRLTSFDGQANGAVQAQGIRSAIVAKADGIALVGIDCDGVSAPLQEAITAGIKVTAVNGFKCGLEPAEQSLTKLVNAPFVFSDKYPNATAFAQAIGRAQADYIIVQTQGMARVIEVTYPLGFSAIVASAFDAEIAKCASCQIVENLAIALADISSGGALGQKVSAALLSHPDANAFAMPADSWMNLGVGQAIASSGRQITTAVLGGNPTGNDWIRRGTLTMDIGYSAPWLGWALMDELNRAFQGQQAGAEGVGLQIMTKDRNLPPAGQPYTTTIDYASAYKKAWGVGP